MGGGGAGETYLSAFAICGQQYTCNSGRSSRASVVYRSVVGGHGVDEAAPAHQQCMQLLFHPLKTHFTRPPVVDFSSMTILLCVHRSEVAY